MTGRTIALGDGRRLGHAEFGDPGGVPLLYFHGFPGSRLEAALAGPAAAALGIRLVGVDRPGFGLSDPLPGRRILDWPADVVELANALGLDRFAVVGVSGGAPYALACAFRIPERLAAAGVVCGLGPMDRPGATRGMLSTTRLAFLLSRRAPWLLAHAYGLLARRAARRPERLVARLARFVSPQDVAALARPDVREHFVRSLGEAFRRGTRGPARDLVLYGRPWGFPLESVAAKVHLWHGERDVVVPAAVARAVAAGLPRCRARFLPDEGHFSLPGGHASEILGALAGSARATPVDRPARPEAASAGSARPFAAGAPEARIRGCAHLFAYGTLELPEVMEHVAGRRHASLSAVLDGYARFLVRGRTYPGIVESPGERTRGVLYLDVGAEGWSRLDRFEDDFYERRRVEVVAADGTARQAFAYVVPSSRRGLLGPERWDPEAFRRLHLAAFIVERGEVLDGSPRPGAVSPSPARGGRFRRGRRGSGPRRRRPGR